MEDQLSQNPYKTLNVPKDATLATIRSAYRKLVLSCHPDKVLDPTAKQQKAKQFHEVQQAYEVLSDEVQRRRYDEKNRLDELRAEMMEGRGPSRKSPRPTKYEMRGNQMYETREPREPRAEDNVYTYAEAAPSSRKYDRYSNLTPRKTSGREQEEKISRKLEDERDRRMKEAARTAEASARDHRTKKREMERKESSKAKSKSNLGPYVEDFSDSELDDRYFSAKRELPRKRTGEVRKRDREEPSRRSGKGEVRDDELENKTYFAQYYINKSREAVEIGPRGSGRSKATSTLDARPPPPPPPPPPRPAPAEKRSSGRGRGHGNRVVSPIGRSGKDSKRSPEIVDPLASRRPGIPGASSESSKLKSSMHSSSKREPHRSATYQPASEFKPPPMRRYETAPINGTRQSNPIPPKSSTLRNMKALSDTSDSSDSDSEMTEEYVPPRKSPLQRSTTYKIHEDDENLVLKPETIYPRTREVSPKSRRTSDRPSVAPRGSTTKTPPLPRAMSYAYSSDDRPLPRQKLSRTQSSHDSPPKTNSSSRGGSKLFGEEGFATIEETSKRSPKIPGDEERHVKPYSRRGSEEVHRDVYPGSKFNRRPPMERKESVYGY